MEELDNDTDGIELDNRGVGFVSVDIDNQIIEDAREFLASHPKETAKYLYLLFLWHDEYTPE